MDSESDLFNLTKSSEPDTSPRKIFPFYGKKCTFSNFAPYSISAFGIEWSTSEHLYQALKFKGSDDVYYLAISDVENSSPFVAKKMGRSKEHPLRDDWEEVKDHVMYFVVCLKVLQNPSVQEFLLDTKDLELVERSPTDAYWGCGKDGTGRNQHGKTWMRIRSELNNGEKIPVLTDSEMAKIINEEYP